MDKHYDITSDTDIYQEWINNNNNNKNQSTFNLILPPPNVTGILHMGHALNVTIHDIIIRWKKMNGEEVCWIPGMDHAGIATQNVVEKQLRLENKTRHQIGREQLIERIWKWKDQNSSIILDQLKKVGCLCNWDQERFTMDDEYQLTVKQSFIKLYQAGLIYRDKKIINWCVRCEISLSDEEVIKTPTNGYLYHIKYSLEEGDCVIIATSRPETLFGDVALACNPNDLRYKNLIGRKVRVLIVNRLIPIIAADEVDINFGTGLIKITPAHDETDFIIGQRNKLEIIEIIDNKGNICNTTTEFDGMDRIKCRNKLITQLKCESHLYHKTDHICYRCNTNIEYKLSLQWFLKMQPLADLALNQISNINFYPSHYHKIYLHWLTNIKDWCISRQIWWGYRIPIYYCQGCGNLKVDEKVPISCDYCQHTNFEQETDVLDTWFSSWLWPYTLKLESSFPLPLIISGADILFFWIIRMIMAGLFFTGKLPFSNIYLHGIIRDQNNEKMSKSKGNVLNPIDIINKHGADTL